jgi:peroxiredoxin
MVERGNQLRLGICTRLTAAALLSVFMAACASPEQTAPSAVKPVGARQNAPEFALKDVNGTTVRLSDYRGKVVLLNFWATWCGPCKIEVPWFIEFEQANKDRGFAVIGVSMDEEGWAVVKPFLAEMNINYRTLLGNDSIAQLYGGVDSLPTSFLIDRDGRVASSHLGLTSGSKSLYKNEIQELLSAQPGGGGRAAVAPVPAGAK